MENYIEQYVMEHFTKDYTQATYIFVDEWGDPIIIFLAFSTRLVR